eukprot:CAMPEP_0180140896 /NCGR_PEP_ID=MMETSP0986-20121125/14533_1 /TAXON_ID=697907 /ORGANISM="non described non described, Strain CCMP2293" /LENGTH=114 /DNA_ID=CAMNT_0022083541 /DNA_START=19 /DNA_END=363 /DNA_ORIENTATION=-
MADLACGEGDDCACYQSEVMRPMKGFEKGQGSKPFLIGPGETKHFCMCRESKNFPYCDGSHVEINENTGSKFAPVVFKNESEEEVTKYVCMCGHSQKSPFCDGSHKKLTERKVA